MDTNEHESEGLALEAVFNFPVKRLRHQGFVCIGVHSWFRTDFIFSKGRSQDEP